VPLPSMADDILYTAIKEFDHIFYTLSYSDLARFSAVEALDHFKKFGFWEGRYGSSSHYLGMYFPALAHSFSWYEFQNDNRDLLNLTPLQCCEKYAVILTQGIASSLDNAFHAFTKRPTFARHDHIFDYLASHFNEKSMRVLEIGSRAVCSNALWKSSIPGASYVGFDALSGENVDVVGDAHCLSSYFEPNSFDLVISFAVFEHLAMPWVVAEEVSKILKVGGHVVVETHFSFSEHELLWQFFQFNANALEVLFNPSLGFSCIDSGHDSPMIGRFAASAAPYLVGQGVGNLWCHFAIIAQKTRDVKNLNIGFDWRSALPSALGDSMYPQGTGLFVKEL